MKREQKKHGSKMMLLRKECASLQSFTIDALKNNYRKFPASQAVSNIQLHPSMAHPKHEIQLKSQQRVPTSTHR
jgi:hypothetical protein